MFALRAEAEEEDGDLDVDDGKRYSGRLTDVGDTLGASEGWAAALARGEAGHAATAAN